MPAPGHDPLDHRYTREMAQEYLAGLGPSAEQVSWAIEAGSSRQSFLTWAQVYAVLLHHERVARRPG